MLAVPHDGGTTYQPGARLAPYHVRRVSALLQNHHPVHDVDIFTRLRCVDAGNVVFPPFDRTAMRAAIEAEVRQLVAAEIVPIVLGGDHSITLPVLRALSKHIGPLAVIHIDAHLDLSGPETWSDDFHHGTPIRHALDEGLIERGQLYQLGIRGSRATEYDDGLAAAHDSILMSADEIGHHGVRRACSEIRERIGSRPVYITFDIDAVDPAFAPGTGTPVPGGLTSREAIGLLRGLAGLDVRGADVVEVCPSLDHADITSHLAAHLLWEMLALVAVRRTDQLAAASKSNR